MSTPDPATTKWVPVWDLDGGGDLHYTGDYAASTTYRDGDVVVYNGIAYLCVEETSDPPTAWPSADLSAVYQERDEKAQPSGYASLGTDGKVPLAQLPPVGADLTYNGDFPANTPYTDGDIVVSNGVAYLCVQATANAPAAWPGGPTPASSPVIPYGTTLPVSPADGQEAVLVDSITNPSYQWRFRYNAQSSSAYKWEFVGGTPWHGQAYVGVAQAMAGGWAAYHPTLTLPRGGDYDVISGVQFTSAIAGTLVQIGQAVSSVALGVLDAGTIAIANAYVSMSVANRAAGATAGQLLQNWLYTNQTTNVFNAWMKVWPVRVS